MALATSRPPAGHSRGPGGRGPGTRVLGVLRGLLAVARLLARALGALLAAVLALPPGLAARIGQAIADEYRAGRAGAIDAEVLDDPNPDHGPFDVEVCR